MFKQTGDWLQVEAASVELAAWVSAQYVKGLGPAEQDSQEWIAINKEYEERAKPVSQRDFGGVLRRSELLVKEAKNPA